MLIILIILFLVLAQCRLKLSNSFRKIYFNKVACSAISQPSELEQILGQKCSSQVEKFAVCNID